MKKVILLASFFTGAPLVIFLGIVFFFFLSYQKEGKVLGATSTVSYAALPTVDYLFYSNVTQTDSRTELVRQFFKKYRSPLEPYAEDVVTIADKYGLDFRLIPAIAMQESNLCLKAPENSFNCWGFGIYGKKVTRFNSYTEGVEAVTKTLATKYKTDGLVTPEQIMTRYTPSSNGNWARGVNQFMAELE